MRCGTFGRPWCLCWYYWIISSVIEQRRMLDSLISSSIKKCILFGTYGDKVGDNDGSSVGASVGDREGRLVVGRLLGLSV